MAEVLVVEDDPVVRAALLRYLLGAGHTAHGVDTALAGIRAVAARRPDVVVLDLGLPDLDGADAVRVIRGNSDIPIIVATVRDAEAEMVRLLDIGADDYLVKPFSGAQLTARLRAVLRRTGRSSPVITAGPLRIETAKRTVTLDGRPVMLSRKEFDLLAYLAARPGEVVGKRELVERVWHQASDGVDQTVDVHLSWLRRKLGETAAAPRLLHTVRGVGIRLVP